VAEEYAPSEVPAGWHPDPSGSTQLRWWDGRSWTEHVAAMPGSAHAPASESAPAVSTPPREKTMTGATWAVLAVTALVVGGTGAGLWWGAASARAQVEAEAPAVLDGFLSSATSGDAGWADYVSPQLAASAPAIPLFGDAAAAELIELSVSAQAGPVSYGTSAITREASPDGEDIAWATVDLTYSFVVDGAPQTATATQLVWLARPFYYGDDQPAEAVDGKTPSRVGPWRVAAIAMATPDQLDGRSIAAETTYTTSKPVTRCKLPQDALVSLAEAARLNGALGGPCINDGGAVAAADGIDAAELASQLPALNYQSTMPEVLGLVGSYDVPAPLAELRIAAGSDEYVFVYAVTGAGGQRTSTSDARLVAISKAETR